MNLGQAWPVVNGIGRRHGPGGPRCLATNGAHVEQRLISDQFPRSSAYHPDWIVAGLSGGANPLWLIEWLIEQMNLRPGMRVLDLGCGRALSSIFLRRELGVEVWAADLWFSPSENWQRARDAGCDPGVYPLRVDARALPFAAEFFDAVVSVDSFVYYGTDDMYLANLARFVKPGGLIGIAGAGLVREIDGPVPEHLRAWWVPELASLHSPDWWRRHWERSGVVDVALSDNLADGWKFWLQWHRTVCPDNAVEIAAVEADAGQYLGYVRTIARRKSDVRLDDPITTIPANFSPQPVLRNTIPLT